MKATTTAKKPTKPTTKHASKNAKVNIYPNRMSLAVATLAAVSLALFGLMLFSGNL